MLSDAALVALIRRFQASLAVVADRTAFAMALAWQALGSYDEPDVARYTERTAPAVKAAQTATVRLSAAFYATFSTVRPPGLRPDEIAAPAATRDPFIAYWRALQQGNQWTEAVASGRGRAEAVGSNLVVSTSRRTGDAVADATGQRVVGWRRVLTGRSCAWCATVATQRYRSSEAADFGHSRCDCSAVPIYGDRDPGRIINGPVLDVLKAKGKGYWQSGYVNPDGTPAASPAPSQPATGT